MGGPERTAWPDGGAYLTQPAVLVETFNMVTEMMLAAASAKRAAEGKANA